jgi:hypothetical protein
MKKKSSLLLAGTLTLFLQAPAESALIAYWNFNGLTTSTNNGTSYSPDSGAGSLNLAGWTTTGTTGITAFTGSTVNALNDDPAGQALALQGGTTSGTPNNGATLVLQFSTLDLEDVVLTFASRKTATGFSSNQVAYSTDGTNYTNFGSPYDPVNSSTLGLVTFDFSTISDLDDKANAYIRITFTGATNNSGNNRIDNIQINAIPEPGAAFLGSLGMLCLLRRRR